MRFAGEVTFLITCSSFSIISRASPTISSCAAISARRASEPLSGEVVRRQRGDRAIKCFEQTDLALVVRRVVRSGVCVSIRRSFPFVP